MLAGVHHMATGRTKTRREANLFLRGKTACFRCAARRTENMSTVLQALMPLALLLLSRVPTGTFLVDGSSCAWRSCRHVILEPSVTDADGLASNVALTVRRCEPELNPTTIGAAGAVSHASSGGVGNDGCQLPAAAEGRVASFGMTRAGLRSVPLRDLCRFANLTAVDLSENGIAEFFYPLEPPLPSVCHRRLRSLSLRGNRLSQLDLTQLLYLDSLELVDVSENAQLESIFVTHLPSPRRSRLKTLNAARCRIKQVDVSLVRLASLQEVNLSHNQVTLLTNRLRWSWTLEDIRAVEREREFRRSTDASYYLRLTVRLTHNQLGSEAFGVRRLWGLPMPPLDGAPDAVVARLKLYRDAFQPFLHVDNRGSTIACDCRALHAWRYFTSASTAGDSNPGPTSAGLFSRRNALAIDAWLDMPCEGVVGLGKAPTLLTLKGNELQCDHRIDCPSGCHCIERVADSSLTVDCTGTSRLTSLPRQLPAGVHRVRYRLLLAGNQIQDLTDLEVPTRADLVDELDLSGNRLSRPSKLSGLQRFTGLRLLNLTDCGLTDLPDALLEAGARRGVRIVLGDAQLACDCELFEPARWRKVLVALPAVTYRHLRCRNLPLLDFRRQNCPPTAVSSAVAAAAAADNVTNNDAIIVFRDRRPRGGSGTDDGPGSGSSSSGNGRGDLVGASVLLVVGVASGAVVVALAVATVAVAVANSRRVAEFFFLRGESGSIGRSQVRSGVRRSAAATCSATTTTSASATPLAVGSAGTSTSCGSGATSSSGANPGCYFAKKSPLMTAAHLASATTERLPLYSARCCGIPPDLVPASVVGIGGNMHSSPYDLPRYVCSTDFAPLSRDIEEGNIDDEASGMTGFRPDRLRLCGQLILRNSACSMDSHRMATTLPLPERRRFVQVQRKQKQQQQQQPQQQQLNQQHRSSSGSDIDFGSGRFHFTSSSQPPPLPPPRHTSAQPSSTMSISPSMAKLLDTIAFPVGMETDV